MKEQNIQNQTTININEKATMIWNIADILRGLYKPHEYGNVILPMTVIKRFHDCLLPTRDKVMETYENVKHFEVKDGFLTNASGYQFYNVSEYTFDSLLADSANIEDNFRKYLAGFSDNVLDILENFKFEEQIKNLANSNMLFYIIQEFNTKKGYMGPDKVTSVDMGYIFEDLIKRFSESYNEEAGAHFTSRDIIYLMTDLLLAEDKDTLTQEGVMKTVYDMTMGTSQMLGCMEERLKALDADAEVTSFGQEINPSTYAIAKADMLIKGGNPENMKLGDTLSDDKFKNYTFDYIISNPPFGINWKVAEKAVKEEYKQGDNGRFGVGLPSVSDGQMLFTLNGVKKLKDNGKMAIIHNASPLFNGDAGQGPSEIRRYLIENDWLDAIIQLSTEAFYNTEISTYIWLISKNKPHHREGKVQLIDASKCFEKRWKSIGKKKNDITEQCRELIVKAYGEFAEKEYEANNGIYCISKIFDNIEFGYNKIVIETPELDAEGNIVKKGKKIVVDVKQRDTENVPLEEDIETYFNREVIPYNPIAIIDKAKTKVGYEIPFTRFFYEYTNPEKSDLISDRIYNLERDIMDSLRTLFAEVRK